MSVFTKDPDAILDYKVDWSDWLGADTIATSQWILSSDDITNEADSNTSTTATIFISGGTAPSRYTATNRIVTDGGRTDDRTIELVMVPK